jgi:hypothetical protein
MQDKDRIDLVDHAGASVGITVSGKCNDQQVRQCEVQAGTAKSAF